MARHRSKLEISHHAVERFHSRHAQHLSYSEARTALERAWSRAVRLKTKANGFNGGDQHLLPDLKIIAISKADPIRTIITVLPAPPAELDEGTFEDGDPQPEAEGLAAPRERLIGELRSAVHDLRAQCDSKDRKLKALQEKVQRAHEENQRLRNGVRISSRKISDGKLGEGLDILQKLKESLSAESEEETR